MTSNVGSQMIQEIAEQGGRYDEMRAAVMESLQARFLPEFLNRIDEIIVFHPLDRSEIRKIVDLQIKQLEKLLEDRDLGLEVTEAARQETAKLHAGDAENVRLWQMFMPWCLAEINGIYQRLEKEQGR
jgi:ATP-dependent Clp protease ATP-binding subunit ClpB